MIRKNDTTRYHLCYLIVNDSREDKYDGLSHVAEHTLLIPADISLSFIAQGYTCVNHVYLYFGSERLEDLQEIDRRVMGGEVITEENIRCAKSQVIEEIRRMRDQTAKFESLISFVTEKRVQKSAIGDPLAVACIQIRDIANWFDSKRQRGQIYRFLYKDAHVINPFNRVPETEESLALACRCMCSTGSVTNLGDGSGEADRCGCQCDGGNENYVANANYADAVGT